jgi:hypothetical protein
MVAGPFAGNDERRPPVFLLLLLLLLLPTLGVAPARAQAPGSCSPTATHLCLNNFRFQVDVDWMLPSGPGKGQAVPLTADTGLFWFFGNSNLELIVKVLDGRPVNGHFWVYYGGLSDVEYQITVTDTKTGVREIYANPPGRLASGSDTSAFDAEPAATGLAALQAAVAPAPAAPLRLGEELQVNVTTQGDQIVPAVAAGPDGGFMIVWHGETGAYGRIYDAGGHPRGGEILLNAPGSSLPDAPRVAADASGRFMVVWSDRGSSVRGRLFGADGQPAGGEILIAGSHGPAAFPDIAAAPGGSFLVIWSQDDRSVHAQRFDAQGGRIGGESQIYPGSGSFFRLAALSPAGFLVTWNPFSQTGTNTSDLLAQRLDAAGQPVGAPIQVAVATPGLVQGVVPVAYADGGFSVVWVNGALGHPEFTGLFARRYAADGSPAGGAVRIRQGSQVVNLPPAAVALPSGDTWALWFESGLPLDPNGGVFSGVFDAAWNLRGAAARVNTYTADFQGEPAVAAGPAGLVAAWTSGTTLNDGSGSQDGSRLGVFGQRFTTASCAADSSQLCLAGRFRVAVRLIDPRSDTAATAQPIPLTADSGAFWFFDASNVEVMVKVLDGRALNGHFWVFAGALSDVEYTITVTDTQTGTSRTYHNTPHQLASRADTEAF